MNRQIIGIDFGQASNCKDNTPTAEDHQTLEPSSYSLLLAQQEHQKMRDEIKAQFLEDEVKKFYRSMTNAYKKTARREARLDLEEDNRKELLTLKTKLEAEMLGTKNQQMESYREQLRQKDAKIKELEARVEASENDKKIQELEGTLAAMRKAVEGLKKGGAVQEYTGVIEEGT